jgi:hypothetical protein
MARFNEILVGRFNRGLQKVFGLRGSAPVPQLASEVQPVFPLFNGAENRYVLGWLPFGHTDAVAGGGAGTQTHYRFHNPLTSSALVVLQRVQVQLGGADTVTFRYTAAEPGDLGSAGVVDQVLDARAGSNTQQSPLKRTSEVSAAPTLVGQPIAVIVLPIATTAASFYDLFTTGEDEMALLPGSALDILTSINTSLRVNSRIRVRFLEDSEKS